MAEYDLIVVGAGAAGAIVAARASEDASRRVLLLEAGPGDRSVYIRMPAALAYPLTREKWTWTYETGPEPTLDGRSITHVRGRLLGGSSSVNGLVFVRGNRRDYDGWAAAGLPGWSYAHCLPYFRRLERFSGGDDLYRGREGPVAVRTSAADNQLFHAFLEAGQQHGQRLNPDYNGADQEGVHVYQTNIDNGIRASSAWAYLRPAAGRANLTVRSGARALRVVFSGRRAVGVEIRLPDGRTETVHGGEIVLSGGAYNSPHLLLLSGVGDPEALAAHGIGTVAAVPGVGRGLKDHPAISVAHRTSRRGVSPVSGLNPVRKAMVGLRWLLFRSGLGATNFWEVGTFFRSRPEVEVCDIQHEFIPMIGEFSHGAVQVDDGLQYQTCLMRPRSAGAVSLRSADPLAPPAIVHNYLDHPDDMRDLVNGIRRTTEMIAQKAWDGLRGKEMTPGVARMGTREIEAWIRAGVSTQYHPCSSCRMGVDDMSVVNAEGRVHETEGLRVVDASIFPDITSGNLNAPTMMVAEKIADRLRGRDALPPVETRAREAA